MRTHDRRTRTRTRTAFVRALAGLLAVTMVSPLWAAPGDITQVPAPMLGSDPPEAKDIPDGDASVSTQTGALQYSFPIEVPPGRLGMQPQLALSYSSQGATYGGVASGWSLSIPEIRLDTSESLLKQKYWAGLSADPWFRERYISTLSGSRPLVPVTESFPLESGVYQAFRAQNDSGWVRYERMKSGEPYLWRARTPEGITHYFGDTSLGGWSPNVVPLTRSVDAFGNTIEYIWQGYQLSQIRYTSNPAVGLKEFARIEFEYAPVELCGGRVPVGAQEDRRLDWIDGERRLTKIRALALHPTNATVEHTREYTLGYDMAALACNARHAPVRLLTSIQQSAWGTNAPIVALPPVTFSYNRLERTFDDTTYTSSSPPWLNFARSDSVSTGERSANEWPSIREMMLDFDGDGLVDRIALVPDANECRFHWQKNLGRNTAGGFNFGIPVEQTMPRLPWANGTRGPDESCTLNYQFTKRGNILDPVGPCEVNNGTYLAYRWTDITGDGLVDLVAAIHHDAHYDPNTDNDPSFFQHLRVAGWGSCAGDGGSCPVPSSACVHDALVCDPDEGCRLHHPSLSTCLSEAPIVTCDRLMKGMDQHGPTDADQNELGPIWPDGHTPPSGNCSEKKEHLRCDRFPWFVHENVGGAFEPQGEVKYQPIPLESDSGDSSIGGGGSYSSTAHALQDMDGDGYMDVVVRGKPLEGNAGYPPIWWLVFRGDGSGGFHVDDSGYPYLWYVPENAHINGACPATAGSLCATPPASATDGTVSGYSSLVDLNGDGAVDYAWSLGANLETDGFWNNGLSFSGHGPGDPPQGDYVGAGLLSRSWVHATERVEPWDTPANWLVTGWRQSHSHLVDVDDDGRPDLIESPLTNYTTTPWPTSLRFNDGGTFLAPLDLNQLPNLQSGLMQRTEATGYLGDTHWSVKWDLVDMDGDGLPEQWKFPLDETQNIAVRRDLDTQPLRLLKRIDNGRGGAVEVVYASTNDPGDTVTQDASVRKALPRTQWVVETLRIHDQWDPDISKTTYKYELPVWKADERGRFGFRGFERVRTYAPSNALTIDEYDYAVDWSGRLARSRTFTDDDYANPKSIAETDWEPHALFDGAITTYHAPRERKWTCNNGQSEASCMASNTGRVETITELEPLPSAAAPQMYVTKNVYTTKSGTYQAGDRRRTETVGLVSDADDYRVYTKGVTEYELANTFPLVESTTRHVENGFDPTYRVQTSSEVLFNETPDPYDHHRAVTTWTYDMSTGVKLTTRSPNNHSTALVESYIYDPTKRFVTTTTNEKGHSVHRQYHSGTGALLTEFGPNSVWCGWGCIAWEQTWTDIDGLGRPVASWVNRETASGYWLRTQVGRYKYVDHVASGARTNVETGTLIEYDSNRWTNEKTELDGRGRPDIVTVTTGGAADAVTTYDYDQRGHLVAVTLPDPSQNNTSTVTYTYGYDSLGRPTSMRRPAVGGPSASGIDLSYDGLLHSRTEVAGSQGGPAARTDLVHDAFGRLVEVREFTSATAYESTEYKYDANDNVRSIRNPDFVVTELFHDFEGRRTKIVRNGRTWKYGYWPGGELKFETAHHGFGSETQYTTSYVYDELGREKSRNVGVRNLTGNDPQLFGVGQISFGYDSCTNGIGRLCSSTHPWGVLTSTFSYDAEGNPTVENRTFKFASFQATRTSRATYGPGGRVASQTYADHSAGQNNGTVARFEYDGRALPRTIKWQNGATLKTVAEQARNTAGLVTVRYTNLLTSGWNESQSNWTYDPLTRVKSQQVVQGQNGLAVELAKQELDYFGQDDPSRLKHWMRRSATQTSYYDMSFGYDQRHQLATVSEAANKFSAYYWFYPSGKLSSAWIGGNPPAGHEVVSRWVSYVYGDRNTPGIEPDAPIGLQDFWTGTYTRSYGYDTAGNMVSRSGGTPLENYLYDGEDQLRRASSSNGIEEYFYDHTGNRAGIVRRNSSNTVTDVRVFMGDAEVVYYPSGAVSKTFAHLSLGTPVARITNRTDIELQYHGLSNNTLVSVPPNGTTRSAFVHAPYGELLESVGTALPDQHRRFNDKYRDDLTKLSYYGVRYYDGIMLGWTQADPLFRFNPDAAWDYPRRSNLYSFSLNNPLRYLDPDGRDAKETAIVVLTITNPIVGFNVIVADETGSAILDKKTFAEAGRNIGRESIRMAQGVASGGVGGFAKVASIGLEALDTLLSDGPVDPLSAGRPGAPAGPLATKTAPTERRVKLRKSTREKIEANQPRDENGQMIDPNTKEPLVPGKIDTGHKPGQEWRVRKKMHEDNGSTRQEVIEAENDPDLYHLENQDSNRSHKYEQKH